MGKEGMMQNNWERNPSDVVGLKYIPTIKPEYLDDEQRMFVRVKDGFGLPMCIHNNLPGNTPLAHSGPSIRQSHVDMLSNAISSDTKTILEIGINVYKKPLLSTTRAILENKEDDCVYLGIDVNDKSSINDVSKNIHTMKIDSSLRKIIREKMLELGMKTIDLLMIDGDHSITLMVNDWCFTEFLSPRANVIIHDTNVHIGPRSVFDAIDETLFDKQLIGSEIKSGKFLDYGMGIARRLF